jgi:hypothetical protein
MTIRLQHFTFTIMMLIASSSCFADYVPPKLFDLILKADKIAYGEIVAVDSLTFSLKPEWSYDGATEIILIKKFTDWSCSQRWTTYQTGQRLFVFLKSGPTTYLPMSPGIEYELPVWRDSVYINERTLIAPPPPELAQQLKDDPAYRDAIPSQDYQIDDYRYSGYKSEIQKFILTIKNIRGCFYYQNNKLISQCEDRIIERMALKDRIFRWTWHVSTAR